MCHRILALLPALLVLAAYERMLDVAVADYHPQLRIIQWHLLQIGTGALLGCLTGTL